MPHDDLFPIPQERLTDIDRRLLQTVARWGEKEVRAGRLEHHESWDGLLAPALRKLFVDIGLQSLVWPADAGGGGLGGSTLATTAAAIVEQVAWADVGLAALLADSLALQALLQTPDRAPLLAELAPVFLAGRPAPVALVFPDYGTDDGQPPPAFHGLQPPARLTRQDDHWLLSGAAIRPQAAALDAVLFAIVAALPDGEPALALVPGEAPGLTRGEPINKTGLAASRNADLACRAVVTPDNRLLGEGAAAWRDLRAWCDLGCAAAAAGALLAAWEILKEWGEVRVIKGKGQIFKENPLVASVLGEIGERIIVGRRLLYDLAALLARPIDAGAAMTARAVAHAVLPSAVTALHRAMELMGSAGYASEWQLERLWRDVKTLETTLGPTPAIQTEIARRCFELRTL